MRNQWFNKSTLRQTARLLAAGALMFSGAQLASGSSHLENELVIVATGGAFEQALKENFYDAFTKATGVKIIPVASARGDQWAKVRAMAQAGKVEWDIVTSHADTIATFREYLAKLDCNAIPNAGAQGLSGTCQEERILRTIGGGVLTYSTKAFPAGKQPRNWADFWDVQKFPGPRGLPNYGSPWEVLALAMMADGVSPDKVFPLDLDRAFKKMDQVKPHVKVWWKSGDQSQQMLRDGEVVMAWLWDGRAVGLKNAGSPVDFTWNQGLKDAVSWSILKGAPHPKAAMAFLNFFMDRPEAHLAFSRIVNYATANRLALNLMPAEERQTKITFEANTKTILDIDAQAQWIAANRDRMLERWNAWIAK